MVNSMPTEMLAGQRLMVGFDGLEFGEDLRFLIETVKVGGLILFKRNIDSPAQVEALCRDCQAAAVDCGLPPLFIAIDQEGGQVARLKAPFTEFAGNPAMTSTQDAVDFARITARELHQIGVNMNMAPVLDVAIKGIDSIMQQRAFGGDARWVTRLGTAMIQAFQSRGIMAVAKHFPGIGRTVLDSHLSLPDLDVDMDALAAVDLVPFKAAITEKVAGVMLSHIRYTALDPVWPASLSPAITRDLLRRQLGYQGVVMTDDLDMGAIKPAFDMVTAIDQLLIADVDIALICHKGPDIEAAWQRICQQLSDDRDLERMGQRSLRRILDLKNAYLQMQRGEHLDDPV